MAETARTIIVTGASSQIGRCTLPRLATLGHQVHALSRQPPAANEAGIIWHPADLRLGKLPDIPADTLIHLAHVALLPPTLLACRSRHPGLLRRVVAFSSTSRFTKEDSADPREQAVAAELAEAEQQAAGICAADGIAWTVLRPTLVYGLGLDKNVETITRFIRRFGFFPVVGGGKGLRQPVHADDLASACIAALDCPASFDRAYNLSGGETLTYRQMVERIFQALGKPPRILPIPLPVFQALMQTAALLPRYRYLTPAMASRMNQDLCFDHAEASRDFGYAPREFAPYV